MEDSKMPMDKKAKMHALKMLRQMAMEMIKDQSEGPGDESMQKVAVMAKDKAGLQEGLEKAQEVLGDLGDEESSEEEPGESSDEEEMGALHEAGVEDEHERREKELLAELEALHAKRKAKL